MNFKNPYFVKFISSQKKVEENFLHWNDLLTLNHSNSIC